MSAAVVATDVNVTMLGSGEALGMPAPMCDCEYCTASDRRRRPALLVEGREATVVLDAGPDLKAQLAAVGQPDVDAVFVTHHHFDHVAGLQELNHAAMPFEAHVLNDDELPADDRPPTPEFGVYLTATARLHLEYTNGHVADRLDPGTLAHGDPVTVGDLSVVPFPVDHARPAFDTVGFAVYGGHADGGDDPEVVYAPDAWSFLPSEPAGQAYEGADLLVAEGSALLGVEGHGTREDLEAALAAADADRTVLVNASEHLARAHTDALESRAAAHGYELGADLATYRA